MKLSANLTTLFHEAGNLLARYEAARAAGFRYVEVSLPYSESAEALVTAKEQAGMEQVLLNAPPGDWGAGDRGLACLPHRVNEFRRSMDEALRYAKALRCPRVHVMAGLAPDDSLRVEAEASYIDNIRYAAELLAEAGITCIIEPINLTTIPGYFLFSYEQALRYMENIRAPNLKIMLDIFHMQQICGQLTATIKRFLPHTGHIQIAQVPDRNEPDSAGELDYAYIFDLLRRLDYDGFIGCEYTPTPGRTTDQGLGWVEKFRLSLD